MKKTYPDIDCNHDAIDLAISSTCSMTFIKIPPCASLGINCGGTEKELYLSKYPITQMQFFSLTGSKKEYRIPHPDSAKCRTVSFVGDQFPHCSTCENEIAHLVERLNELQADASFRLPRPEEWVYACRAGTTTKHYKGNQSKDASKIGWFMEHWANPFLAILSPHNQFGEMPDVSVGQKEQNDWGYHDMLGTLEELTYDGSKYYEHGASIRFSARDARSDSMYSSGHRILAASEKVDPANYKITCKLRLVMEI